MADAVSNSWAVLIGINFYKGGKSLKGCVQDVISLKAFLDERSSPMHTKVFTASEPADLTVNSPSEEPDSLPTYDNITHELRRIKSQAKEGDAVYIHYSGHGVKLKSSLKTGQDPSIDTKKLALVLFDQARGSRYLRGEELAYLLKEMVDEKLAVTLVLDCCFAGSVTRHGTRRSSTVRSIDYDPSIDAAYPPPPHKSLEPELASCSLRDARIAPEWLVNPDGYTILCACGPYEIAEELEFDNGERHGALSHFLLRALKSLRTSRTEINHQSLYQHICARFHASWPQQNPMRYGNGAFSCFGKCVTDAEDPFTSVFFSQEGNRLCLRAGYAHGVQSGDEYESYPLTAAGNKVDTVQQNSTLVSVSVVRGLTSDLVSSDPSISTSHVKSGWIARPRTRVRLQNTSVQLMIKGSEESNWQKASTSRKFLRFCNEDTEGQPCLFKLHVNSRHEYEVIDQSSQRVATLPTVPYDNKNAMNLVLNMLEHVAIYKSIESIENRLPAVSFSESFDVQLVDSAGVSFFNSGVLNVKNHDTLRFKVRNFGTNSIYVHLLDLRPSWKIVDMIQNDGGGDYFEVPWKNSSGPGMQEGEIEMEVPQYPEGEGQRQCEDILKFFVTSRPSSVNALCLKELPRSADDLGTSVRGNHYMISDFLLRLNPPLRGDKADSLPEDWVALNFIVRTTA